MWYSLQKNMYFFSIHVFAISFLWSGLVSALSDTSDGMKTIKSSRSADTCADPSLTQTVFQGFKADTTSHHLNYRFAFENFNSINNAATFADIQPAFRAWPAQQNFTVPLFQLAKADLTEYIFRVGVNSQTPPIISGFTTDVLVIAWVYDSPVCGSVPLMSADLPAVTDHYYTTNAFEQNSLVTSAGWADEGTVAYVLPLCDC